uniref:Photosystem I reaction center subunit VIII n=1 Tax=Protohalopteris sp. TaxID=2843287 RepID=A0A8F0F7C5_9PHAE|nr:photosystem I protein I [Protohalopteris sp.]
MLLNYLPSILVPLTGLVFPAVAMGLLFIYIEKETYE